MPLDREPRVVGAFVARRRDDCLDLLGVEETPALIEQRLRAQEHQARDQTDDHFMPHPGFDFVSE